MNKCTECKKQFEITYKFGDVILSIEEETIEEAKAKADKILSTGRPQEDTRCYDIEVQEVEK